MTKIVYIAARYGRRKEMADAALRIDSNHASGLVVRSSWLDGTHRGTTQTDRMSYATLDLWEVAHADILLTFTEESSGDLPGRARGGRWVEVGYALGLGKRVVCIGPRENIFMELPGIQQLDNLDEFMSLLKQGVII